MYLIKSLSEQQWCLLIIIDTIILMLVLYRKWPRLIAAVSRKLGHARCPKHMFLAGIFILLLEFPR